MTSPCSAQADMSWLAHVQTMALPCNIIRIQKSAPQEVLVMVILSWLTSAGSLQSVGKWY